MKEAQFSILIILKLFDDKRITVARFRAHEKFCVCKVFKSSYTSSYTNFQKQPRKLSLSSSDMIWGQQREKMNISKCLSN